MLSRELFQLSSWTRRGCVAATEEKPASPTFETFVVSILQDDQSGVKQFFNGMSRTPNGGRPIISGGAVRRGCMIWQTMQIGVAAR